MENDPVPPVPQRAPPGDPLARRGLLATSANPEGRLDYLISLSGRLEAGAGVIPMDVTIRYVPDRLILQAAGWDAYRAALGAEPAAGPEETAARMLADLANQLVPRWLEVRLRRPLPSGGVQAVVMQERQPQWSDAALAALLRVE